MASDTPVATFFRQADEYADNAEFKEREGDHIAARRSQDSANMSGLAGIAVAVAELGAEIDKSTAILEEIRDELKRR